MNREQKAATIETLVGEIQESQAIFAVDYRGITVAQVAELRAKLREADASFRVVKNSLTERAADQAGAETLKDYLAGPTALTFVRGDAALAAKAVADYARATQLLPFKGGMMDGATLDAEQIRSISRLPSREVLYGQLVGMVASPITGLVRTLGALVGGLAVALGQVQQKKESGEIPAGESPAAAAPAAEDAPEAETPAEEASATEADASTEEAPSAEPESPVAEDDPPEELARAQDTAVEPPPDTQAEPEPSPSEDRQDQPAQDDDKQADASAEAEQDPADAKSTKED